MNSIKYTFAPVQKFFAVVAIFALVAMPMAQVFAQEALADEPVVQEQSAPAEQEAPAETPEQKTADEVTAPSEPASAELMNCLTGYDTLCVRPEPKVTLSLTKIVCDSETDLPNWGAVSGDNNITADTAASFLEGKEESCHVEPGWKFQWAFGQIPANQVMDNQGELASPWNTTGVTGTNGVVTVDIPASQLDGRNKISVREVWDSNYIPFSVGLQDNVSPEIYCHKDNFNYDNLEYITGVTPGTTYHCVAWNVQEKGSITIEKKVEGDVADWSFDFAGDLGAFTLSDEKPSEIFSGLTVGEYAFDEIVPAGWDLTSVKCTDDAEPSSVALQTAVPAPTPDAVVTLDPGENVTCTFTNTKEVPQTPVCQTEANLLKNGSFEANTVVAHGGDWEIFTNPINWMVSLSDGLELWANGFYGGPSEGKQNAELDGNSPTMITQAVATVPGATYELRFDFSARPDADSAANNSVDALVDGNLLMNATASGADIGVNTWSTYSKTFVAGDNSTDIALKDVGTADSYGSLVDNVCLLKVSDPKPMCDLTIVSDATTMVDDEVDTFAELVSLPLHEAWDATIGGASWIWSEDPLTDAVNDTYAKFLKDFEWYGGVQSATLEVAADNSYEYDLNATSGADANENNFAVADSYNVLGAIVQGENNLSFDVKNWAQAQGTDKTNPAGLMYKLTIKGSDPSCSDEPEVPVCSSFVSDDYDVNRGQDFNLSWAFGGDVDYVEIDGIEGTFGPTATKETSITSDTEFLLTAYAEGDREDEKLFTCSLDVDTHSSGGGGHSSSKKKGSVLGDSEDRPEGGVAGASTEMPAGAPNTGAGGTSPLVVSLPSLTAVLGSRTSVRKN